MNNGSYEISIEPGVLLPPCVQSRELQGGVRFGRMQEVAEKEQLLGGVVRQQRVQALLVGRRGAMG